MYFLIGIIDDSLSFSAIIYFKHLQKKRIFVNFFLKKMFTENQLSEIKKLIHTEKKVVIITHYNQTETIGSVLGLKHFLNNMGVEPTVLAPNDFPKFLKWMPEC